MKKMRMGIVSAATLGALAFGIPAGAAQAAPTAPQSPVAATQVEKGEVSTSACHRRVIRRAEGTLRYSVCSNRGHLKVRGVLDDTRNNGRCVTAHVRFLPRGPMKSYRDCGGTPTRFDTGWHRAVRAHVTLR